MLSEMTYPLDLTKKLVALYLVNEQPRYPFPFVVKDGSRTQFQIAKKTVTISDHSTYSGMSASSGGSTTSAWWCDYGSKGTWRDDYNQLCIDIGVDYQTNLTAVQTQLEQYIISAFTPEDGPAAYLNGNENEIIGTQITLVNDQKNDFRRCGKVLGILSGAVLCVDLGASYNNGRAFQSFDLTGAQFGDFDYDDACVVFIDKPLLSGPTNTSQYSSLNVGTSNKVLRRDSLAVGKENVSEMDFAMAFGRRAAAQHYCTFIWAPATYISTDAPQTFNIGLNTPLANAHRSTYTSDIRIVGSDNVKERLYQYVWGCISSDALVLTAAQNWIGATYISSNYATNAYADQLSAYALSQAKNYTNDTSSYLSVTVDSKLLALSNVLSSYTNDVSSTLSTQLTSTISDVSSETLEIANAYADQLSAFLSTDYDQKIGSLKTDLKEKLSAVYTLSSLTQDSTINEVGIDAVLALRDILSTIVTVL